MELTYVGGRVSTGGVCDAAEMCLCLCHLQKYCSSLENEMPGIHII